MSKYSIHNEEMTWKHITSEENFEHNALKCGPHSLYLYYFAGRCAIRIIVPYIRMNKARAITLSVIGRLTHI